MPESLYIIDFIYTCILIFKCNVSQKFKSLNKKLIQLFFMIIDHDKRVCTACEFIKKEMPAASDKGRRLRKIGHRVVYNNPFIKIGPKIVKRA